MVQCFFGSKWCAQQMSSQRILLRASTPYTCVSRNSVPAFVTWHILVSYVPSHLVSILLCSLTLPSHSVHKKLTTVNSIPCFCHYSRSNIHNRFRLNLVLRSPHTKSSIGFTFISLVQPLLYIKLKPKFIYFICGLFNDETTSWVEWYND